MDISILDDLLLFMSKIDGSEEFYYISQNFLKTNSNPNIDNGILYKAIQKIVKDGYVEYNESGSYNESIFGGINVRTTYIISFDGLVFISQGGYQGQMDRIQKSQNERQNLENENRLLRIEQAHFAKITVRLTWVVAISAVLPSIYALFQILEYFGFFEKSNGIILGCCSCC